MANNHAQLTFEQVAAVLEYSPASGKLFWKPRRSSDILSQANAMAWNERNAGEEAFVSSHPNGYYMGAIFNRKYLAHRVCWMLAHGDWPPGQIDHINGVKTDNRIENLRCVTNAENGKNQKLHKNSKSGVSGVSFCTKRKQWRARVFSGGVDTHIGYFESKDLAVSARLREAGQRGFHENHGRDGP